MILKVKVSKQLKHLTLFTTANRQKFYPEIIQIKIWAWALHGLPIAE